MASGRHSAKGKAKAARRSEREEVRALASRRRDGTVDEVATDSGQGWVAPPGISASARLRSRKDERRADFSHLSRRPTGRPWWLRPWFVVLAALVLVAVAVGAAGFVWVEGQMHPSGPPGAHVVVTVPAGATGSQVADLLAQKKVLSHPLVFRFYLRLHPLPAIQAGPYQMRENEPYASIESILRAGPDKALLSVRLTIPEGLTVAQIAERVAAVRGHSAASFLGALGSGQVRSAFLPAAASVPAAATEPASIWEGLLFPDTYFVAPQENDVQLAQQMADRFDQVVTQAGLATTASTVGMTPYQAIVIASIVQKEANNPTDMAKVAEVIYNRLKAGMPLQVDSTAIYALALGGETVTSEITDAQARTKSPYNTYVVKGLPPTPISAPGEAALLATLHPTSGPWLYYVTIDKQGDEAFATTFAEQNKNIAEAARNGCPSQCG